MFMFSADWRGVDMKLHYQYFGSQWMDDLNSQKYEAYQLAESPGRVEDSNSRVIFLASGYTGGSGIS